MDVVTGLGVMVAVAAMVVVVDKTSRAMGGRRNNGIVCNRYELSYDWDLPITTETRGNALPFCQSLTSTKV